MYACMQYYYKSVNNSYVYNNYFTLRSMYVCICYRYMVTDFITQRQLLNHYNYKSLY